MCCVVLCGVIQLLSVLNCVSEHSLPSVLRCLFDWYDRQNPMDEAGNCLYRRANKIKGSDTVLFYKPFDAHCCHMGKLYSILCQTVICNF